MKKIKNFISMSCKYENSQSSILMSTQWIETKINNLILGELYVENTGCITLLFKQKSIKWCNVIIIIIYNWLCELSMMKSVTNLPSVVCIFRTN